MDTDTAIVSSIRALLERSPDIDATAISVTTRDAIVQLSGAVSTFDEKWVAERAALDAHGVRAVINGIEVQLPGMEPRSDADVAAAVLHLLATSAEAETERVVPIVSDGWVTLTGSVETLAVKTSLRRAVAMILGVTGVTDELAVDAGVTPTRIVAQIKGALDRTCPDYGSEIEVELRGDTVILQGKVGSEAELEEAEWAAWAPDGVANVENHLALDTAHPS